MDQRPSLHALAEFDAEALRANYREIARHERGMKIIPSIKGDAYGFGALETGKLFESLGAYGLFTGSIPEAMALKGAGVRIPIILFGSYLPSDIPLILAHGLVPTVYDLDMARAISHHATGPVDIYVKVDAGLGRLGIPIADAVDVIRTIGALTNVVLAGIYTHLPFGTAEGIDWARRHLADFDALCETLRSGGISFPVSQARASSCVAAGLADRCNAVCVGHLFYGLSPYADDSVPTVVEMRPVVRRLSSRLIHVGRHGQGSDLAIGGLYGLRQGKTTGVLPVGLSSGLGVLREPSACRAVMRGHPVRVLSISLEHATIDLEGIEEPQIGEEVLLVDETGPVRAPLADFARAQGRTPLEAMVNMTGRWQRTYIDPVQDVWAAFNSPAETKAQ